MPVLKYELKQYRRSVLVWALSLSAIIFGLLPVMIIAISGSQITLDSLQKIYSGNAFFTAMNVDLSHLFSPLGVYGYLSTFMCLAAAIFGGNLGLSIFTKEYRDKTADFLFTKPVSRTNIYFSKLLAAAICCVEIGAVYFASSALSLFLCAGDGIDWKTFSLVAASATILSLLYMVIGLFLASLFPSIHSVSLTAVGVAFLTYIFGSLSRLVGSSELLYLSPLNYFDGSKIAQSGQYEPKYIVISLILIGIGILVSYVIFKNKDIID